MAVLEPLTIRRLIRCARIERRLRSRSGERMGLGEFACAYVAMIGIDVLEVRAMWRRQGRPLQVRCGALVP